MPHCGSEFHETPLKHKFLKKEAVDRGMPKRRIRTRSILSPSSSP
ncbi:hypothetical protein CKA32_003329 [Geitlerinema sp. FC II]|nr:hypothetical protein CKA32_003329 [Geitlerinema sp. FC II]